VPTLFRIPVTNDQRDLAKKVIKEDQGNPKAGDEVLNKDPKLRLLADKLELDYTYKDFMEKYKQTKAFVYSIVKNKPGHQTPEEHVAEAFGTPELKTFEKKMVEDSRDQFRNFDWANDKAPTPGINSTMTPDGAARQMLNANGGFVLGAGHGDDETQDLLSDGMDNGTIAPNGGSLLCIEEFKTWMQPLLDEYLESADDAPMPPMLKNRLSALDESMKALGKLKGGKTFTMLVEKAKSKKIPVIALDSGEASPGEGISNKSAVHPERRVATMNKVAVDAIEKAKQKYRGAKVVAVVGEAHANSHEGGIPGLAQLLKLPAVTIDKKSGKMEHLPDDPTNHSMPSKAEQEFIDRFLLELEKQQGGPIDDGDCPDYKEDMRAFAKAEMTRLSRAGKLTDVASVANCLKDPSVVKTMADQAKRVKDRPANALKLKNLLREKKVDEAKLLLASDPALWKVGLDSDLDAKSRKGYTAMHVAALVGDQAQFQALLDAGGDINRRTKDGDTPLTALCGIRKDGAEKGPQATMVDFICQKPGVDLNAENKDGRTAMHLAAWCGNEQSLEKLHARGAASNTRDSRGWTPAQVAAASTKTSAEKFFYDKGLEPNPPLVQNTDPSVSTIDLLLKATLCEPPNDLAKMKTAYEELYSNPCLRPIMDLVALDAAKPRDPSDPTSGGMRFVVANDDNVGKLYNTTDSTPPEGAYDEGANIVMFSAKNSRDFQGMIIHEMTHAAARIVHGMKVIPASDGKEMDDYKKAIESDIKGMASLDPSNRTEQTVIDRINGRMDGYVGKSKTPEKALLQEFLVGVPQLIAEFGEDYVRKMSPEMTKYFDQFATQCNDKAANDPRFNAVRGKVDNVALKNSLPDRKRPKVEEPWYDATKIDQAALLEKIKTKYRTEHGEAKKTPGIDLVYSAKQIEIKDSDKKNFEGRMKLIERGLNTALKTGALPKEISSDALRKLVDESTALATGNPKEIEAKVAQMTTNFVRKSKLDYVKRKIDKNQKLTDEELAEAVVLKAENLVFTDYPPDDDDLTAEVSVKKHQQLVKDLSEKLKALPDNKKANPDNLIFQLSRSVAGGDAMAFYKKKKDIKQKTAHVSINTKEAKRVWLQTLKSI